ncbi:MAG TPA: glycosyltransferase, partial [Candidatus Polarisedimenticolia bacterium]|nr:glycosyltransferase [Candidatus Polarisedimenticolia bacterium]
AIRRQVFERLGGFDEVNLPVEYSDVDFCLRARAAGLRVITLPLMGVVHAESSTRRQMPQEMAAEILQSAAAIMAARWPAEFSRDPYRNPHCELGERSSPLFPWSADRPSAPKAPRGSAGPPPPRQDPAAGFVRRHAKRVVYGLLRKGDLGRRLHTRLGRMLEGEVSATKSPRLVADAERRRPKQHPHGLQPGLSISGYLCSEIGLGQAARNIAYACDRQGLAVSLHDVPLAGRDNDGEFASKCNPVADRMVNLVVAALPALPDSPAEPGRVNILVPFWELSRIPEKWVELARRFDEIWAPSQFIADAFGKDFARPVRLMRQPVRLPAENAAANPAAGRRDRDTLRLLTYLDFDSWIGRKNPAAAVGAFRAAFPPPQRDVELVVKMRGDDDRGARRFLGEASGQDPRIRLIDDTLSRAAMDELIAGCDAFLSLHRSEGFGFGAAEALSAGRAAVATDYGGTTDFITSDTGYPVAYRLQSIQRGQYIETEGQVWAEPLLDSAVAALRAIYDDPDEAAARARRGQTFLRERHGPAAAGSRIEELLDRWDRRVPR